MKSTSWVDRISAISIILGAVLWLLLFIFLKKEPSALAEQIFLLAPLVIVPLGFSLILPISQKKSVFLSTARVLQPLCALLVVISFHLPQGVLSAGLASSWLLVTGLASLWSLSRIFKFSFEWEEFSIQVGLLYLSIGAVWLILYRLGIYPLGFNHTIVLLTAVHFHYAGFAAPLLNGLLGRRLNVPPPFFKALYRGATIAILGGTPLVAAGITFSPLLELIGSFVMATGVALLGVMMVFILKQHFSKLAKFLLFISAGSSWVGMLLACLYAIGEFSGNYIISIPQMVRFHGFVNSLGFALLGLLAFKTFDLRRE